jgi:iron complex outermembrane receptor protein
MLYIKRFLLFVTFLVPIYSHAQNVCNLSIKGRILDADTNLPLSNSTIYLQQGNIETQTDGHGFFNFDQLCQGSYTLQITTLGFKQQEYKVTLPQDTPLITILLEHEGIVLHDVEVIGHQPTLRTTATATTITNSDLVESKGSVLAEILQNIAGVTMMQTGATIAKPVINGMHSNRVLMVNNGIKQEGQQWGSEHAPEIDPFIASQITVIKGAESVRYGAEAIGGVILVEPAPLPINKDLNGNLDLVGSSNGQTGTASAMLEGSIKSLPGLSWRAQGTVKQSGNLKAADYYLANTAMKEKNYSAALTYNSRIAQIELYYSHFNTDLGIFEGAHIGSLQDLEAAIKNGRPFDDGEFTYKIGVPRQAVAHDLAKLKIHKDLNNGAQLDLQYGFQRNARQEFDIRRGDLSAIPALDLILDSHSLDFTYDKINAQSLRTVLGLNATAIINNNVPGTQATPLIPNYDSFGIGVFAIERLVRGKYELEAGIRYDFKNLDAAGYRNQEWYGGTHEYHNVSGSLGAVWKPKQNWDLRSNIGLSWRPPTVNELYSNGLHHGSASIEIGNDQLKSEQGYKWINTFHLQEENFSVEISAYAHYLNHYIYLKPTGEIQESLRGAFPVFDYKQTNALFIGTDVSASYRFVHGFEYFLKGALLRADDTKGKQHLPMIPSNRLENRVRYSLPIKNDKISDAFLQVEYATVFKQGRYNQESDFAPAPPTYSLLNISGGSKLTINSQSIGLNVSANNLLNTSYKEYMNRFRYYAHDLGRNITLRLSYNF